MSKQKLWTKDFIFVSAINFLLMLIMYLLMITIVSYAADKFHASASVAGLVSGIYVIGSLIGRLVTGRFIEQIGSKKVLVYGLIFTIIATALYLGIVSLPILLIIRLIHGICVGIASTATGTIVAKIIPENRRGEGISYFSMSGILATAMGPFLAIFLSLRTTSTMIFMFALTLSVLCFVMSLFVKVTSLKVSKEKARVTQGFKLSNFIEYKALPISIFMIIIGLAYSGVLSFLKVYSEEIHLVGSASLFFLVYAISSFISRPFTGRLLDRKGANIIIYPALILFALGMFILSDVHQSITLLIAAAFIGLGYGNIASVAQATSIKGIAHNRLGLATSTYFIFVDLGFGLGPYFLGLLVPSIGYRGLYLTTVIVILMSIALYYFLHGRKEELFNPNYTALQENQ